MSNASSNAPGIAPRRPAGSAHGYARTYERTDGLTHGSGNLGQSLTKRFAREIGKNDHRMGSGQNRARPCDSRKVSLRFQPGPVYAPIGSFRPSGLLSSGRPSRGCSVSRFKEECSGLSRSRPLTRELKSARCTNTATHRVQAFLIDAPRYHFESFDVACSPIARWRGESRGSNPLRRPTNISAANRAMQYDCACSNPTPDYPSPTAETASCGRSVRGFLLSRASQAQRANGAAS